MCYLGARLRLLNSMNPKAECRKLSVSTINDSSKSEHAWRSSNELAKKQTNIANVGGWHEQAEQG